MSTFLRKSTLAMTLAFALTPLAANAIEIDKFATYTEECGNEESCAEISAFDADSSRVFITNAAENQLRILNVVDENFAEHAVVDLSLYGGGPNSVAVKNGVVAVAVQAHNKQKPGTVELFTTDGTHIQSVEVGALPDMLTFTPDGNYLIVANEGEPNDSYSDDPEGSVSVISTDTWTSTQANFDAFDEAKLKDVRIFGNNGEATVSEDLEPEYVTVSSDSKTAWITLQENNAIAKLDITSATVTDIYGLGYKKHHQTKNRLDASDKDNGINLQTWPILGMYQPDAIASFQRGNATFLVTANEGDARDYDGYSEETRVEDLELDPKAFPNADELQQKENLGRLKTTTSQGDIDGDGDFDEIYSYGARSFSIWNSNGHLVFDSGATFESSLAKFQEAGMDIWVEGRSDDKGPEPESITVGQVGDHTYAFIGLERASGIFVYKLDNPYKPEPVAFFNTKEVGDVGPEGLQFIARDDSSAWLLISNEISNTTSLYEITF